MKTIKFTTNTKIAGDRYKAGTVIGLEDKIADSLIKDGLAKAHAEIKEEPKTKQDPEQAAKADESAKANANAKAGANK